MDIATGYFATARQDADDGYALVSIAKVASCFFSKNLVLNREVVVRLEKERSLFDSDV